MAFVKQKCTECENLFLPFKTKLTCSEECRVGRGKRLKREKYLANAEAVKEQSRLYRLNNPDKIKEMRRTYQEKYPERIRASQQKQYNKDPEKAREYQRQHRKDHPEYLREANRRRRAKLKGIPSERYADQDILDLYGTVCYLCHTEIDLSAPRWTGFEGWEQGLHLDHVTPISKGGTDLVENIRPSHGICNVRKSIRSAPPFESL